MTQQNIIIYKTRDGKASVALYAQDGEVWLTYNVLYYALPMILAIGFRVGGARGIQFRQWANRLERDDCAQAGYRYRQMVINPGKTRYP